MEDLCKQIIEKAMSLGATYADLRYGDGTSTRIVVRNSDVTTFQTTYESGLGLRVLTNGAWGFLASNTPDEVLARLKDANALAKMSARTRDKKIEIANQKAMVDTVIWKPKKPHDQLDIDDKMKFVLESNKQGKDMSPSIKQVSTTYAESDGERIIATSEGTLVKWGRSATLFVQSFVAQQNDLIVERSFTKGGLGGLEAFDTSDALKEVKKEGKTVLALLKAPAAPGGEFPAVLNFDLSYTLAHEAFGHLCEADSVIRGNSILEGKLGTEIASDCVTIIDDPEMVEDNGRPAYGSFPYDDEGIKAVPTTLLEDGVLKTFMHSRETAKTLGQPVTGNARVESYKFFPQVRMTNTHFKLGDFSKEELFAEIKDGVYLIDAKGGQTTGQGTFHVGVSHVYLIKNGEQGELRRGTGIGGRTLDTLKEINAVGKYMEYDIGGCGKNSQSVRTGSNGPMVRLNKITIGG
ncbi:MAG: TldD/PmbA family protein [Candidatus Ranarchaeia archaeon]|jgi:TldD protein